MSRVFWSFVLNLVFWTVSRALKVFVIPELMPPAQVIARSTQGEPSASDLLGVAELPTFNPMDDIGYRHAS